MTPEQNAYVKTLATREEIFEHVAKHLKSQDARSMQGKPYGDGVRCAYRGAGDRMCAVGCLIADDEYDPHTEGLSVTDLGSERRFPVPRPIMLPERLVPHLHMIQTFQELHDFATSWHDEGGLSREGKAKLRDLRSYWLEGVNPYER